MPVKTRRWTATAVSAALGLATGVGLIWFAREQPRPPGSVVLDNGLRSPMPVIVIGPPVWVYLLTGILGALAGAGIALAAFHVGGRANAETV
jgi:hypothetical protein